MTPILRPTVLLPHLYRVTITDMTNPEQAQQGHPDPTPAQVPPAWHDHPGICAALRAAGHADLARKVKQAFAKLESVLLDESDDAPDYDPALTRLYHLKKQAFEILEARP